MRKDLANGRVFFYRLAVPGVYCAPMNHRAKRLACLSPAGFHGVAYREWGEPDNPNVLICVHGLTRNGASDWASSSN